LGTLLDMFDDFILDIALIDFRFGLLVEDGVEGATVDWSVGEDTFIGVAVMVAVALSVVSMAGCKQ